MAEEMSPGLTALTALMQEQNNISNEGGKGIKQVVEEARRANELQKNANTQGKNNADKEEKGNGLVARLLSGTNKFLAEANGLYQAAAKFANDEAKKADEAAKTALRNASKLDPSKAVANVAQKAADFAKDILSLLVKGGLLFGLFKLLQYLSERDPRELLAKARTAYEEFLEKYQGWIDAVGRLGAAAAIWKTAEWLVTGKGPVWLLWNGLKALFAAGGLVATLATSVGTWAKSALFGEEGATKKLWRAFRKVFGAVGLIADLGKIIGTWATSAIFDITKGSSYILWNAFKVVFGADGLIAALGKTVGNWAKSILWTEESPIRKLWNKVTDIFDTKVRSVTNYFDGLGEKINIFGENSQIRKIWTKVDDIFNVRVQKAVKFFDSLGDVLFFGENGALRRLFTFVSGIFGGEGKIAKGLVSVKEVAEDFTGEKSKIRGFFDFLKGIFGADGKVAKGFASISEVAGDFFGKNSSIQNIFNKIGNFFGPESSISTLSTKLSEWTTKFKGFFTFTDDAGGAAKGASGISRLFGSIGGLFGKITGLVTAVTDSAVFKGIQKFFGIGIRWIGKIFAPIGWIMGFVEAVTGFWDGFSAKKGDERTLSERLLDGLAGAINGLIQFIFIDTIKLIQDVVNFGIRQINKFAEFELFGKKITAFTPMEEVTFGDDLAVATEKFIKDKIGSGKLESAKKREAQILALEEKGMTEEEAIKALDKGANLAPKEFAMTPEKVTPIVEERPEQMGASVFTDARTSQTRIDQRQSILTSNSAQNVDDAIGAVK